MSSSPNISVKPEQAEPEIRQQAPYDAELIQRTNEMLRRAADRVVEDRREQLEQNKLIREAAAFYGGWVPGNPSDAQRQEWREDYGRRQEWNALIKEGASTPAPERTLQDLKPAAEMSKAEIISEARDLHARFAALNDRFEHAPAQQRAELREEMKPLALRENELRDEYTGRLKAEISREISQDRVPDVSAGYGR